jgi:hypothetical protein
MTWFQLLACGGLMFAAFGGCYVCCLIKRESR